MAHYALSVFLKTANIILVFIALFRYYGEGTLANTFKRRSARKDPLFGKQKKLSVLFCRPRRFSKFLGKYL